MREVVRGKYEKNRCRIGLTVVFSCLPVVPIDTSCFSSRRLWEERQWIEKNNGDRKKNNNNSRTAQRKSRKRGRFRPRAPHAPNIEC